MVVSITFSGVRPIEPAGIIDGEDRWGGRMPIIQETRWTARATKRRR